MKIPYPIPKDPLFPRLPEALSIEKMTSILQRRLAEDFESVQYRITECVPEYIRYKPGVSCVIGYCLYVSDGNDLTQKIQRVHGRFLTPGAGEEEYTKALKTHTAAPPWGPPVVYLRELEMMISFFPNDRSLRGLHFILDPDKMKRVAQSRLVEYVKEPWLIKGKRTRIDVLSYKPERHCVIQCRFGMRNLDSREKKRISVIGKILRREEGEYIYGTNRKIWDLYRQMDEIQLVPDPLAFDPELSLFFQEEIVGNHPTPTEHPRSEWHSVLCQIAGQLRSFHELKLSKLRTCSHEELYDELCLSMENTAMVLSEKKGILLGLKRQLEKGLPELNGRPLRPTHGDFHLEQILMRCKNPVILDLDSIKLSDPIMDVANLAMHLFKFVLEKSLSRTDVEEAEKVVLGEYFKAKEFQRLEGVYLWQKKAALVRLALSCIKYLPSNWQEEMDFFLAEAEGSPL
jgi:hypothetical protein